MYDIRDPPMQLRPAMAVWQLQADEKTSCRSLLFSRVVQVMPFSETPFSPMIPHPLEVATVTEDQQPRNGHEAVTAISRCSSEPRSIPIAVKMPVSNTMKELPTSSSRDVPRGESSVFRGGWPRLSVGVHGPRPISITLDPASPPPRQAWWTSISFRHDRIEKGSSHPICSDSLTSRRIAESGFLDMKL